MESAKQNLQFIDISSKVRGRKQTDISPTISTGLKIHALGKGNLPSDLRIPSKIEKKVGIAQLINKLNYINFQDGIILII